MKKALITICSFFLILGGCEGVGGSGLFGSSSTGGEGGTNATSSTTSTGGYGSSTSTRDSSSTSSGQCMPKTCQELEAQCGSMDDGCGNFLECGTCPSNSTCDSNTCKCTPTKTCLYGMCGSIDDGCGNMVQCPTCENANDAYHVCGAQRYDVDGNPLQISKNWCGGGCAAKAVHDSDVNCPLVYGAGGPAHYWWCPGTDQNYSYPPTWQNSGFPCVLQGAYNGKISNGGTQPGLGYCCNYGI